MASGHVYAVDKIVRMSFIFSSAEFINSRGRAAGRKGTGQAA